MNKRAKFYWIVTITGLALMFIWIFVTFWLTDGKDLENFSAHDYSVFVGFVAVEIITLVMTFAFAFKLGKLKNHSKPALRINPPTTYDKASRRHGLIIFACSFISVLTLMILGIIIGKYIPPHYQTLAIYGLCIFCAIAVLLFISNFLLKKRYTKRLESKPVGELQQYFTEHRESAENAAAAKLVLLRRLRRFTTLYIVLLAILAAAIAILTAVSTPTETCSIVMWVPFLMFLGIFGRIRFSSGKLEFAEKVYVSSLDYPQIYAVAQKAARKLHCNGEIRIALYDDFNVGIKKFGNIYAVRIGVALLNVLSSEELFQILLHEFSHVSDENMMSHKEADYYHWICSGGNTSFLSGLTSLLFAFPDTVYSFEFIVYQYTTSIIIESRADKAMAEYGSPPAAASALLKLHYYNYFMWEFPYYESSSIFEPEELRNDYIHNELAKYKAASERQSQLWNHLAQVEILSRTASHPTLRMRLETLGITDYHVTDYKNSESFEKECMNALDYVEELVYQERKETYTNDRNSQYLIPKSKVEEWEKAGKPVVPEEYGDIHYALCQLGRYSDAEALCDRAIEELPATASCYAYYMKGYALLHRYDPSGIDYVYRAVYNNNNFLENGLELIGSFCCLTGRQKELDDYRSRAVVLGQKLKDEYSKVDTLSKHDTLSVEHLPDGMLEQILSYIRSIDDGSIQDIFLVRKTITENFSTSAFIIRFDSEAEEDSQNEILHKTFCYLNTCSDWQFSLFDYDTINVKVEKISGSCVYSAHETVLAK